MTTVVSFLLARIAEDKEALKAIDADDLTYRMIAEPLTKERIIELHGWEVLEDDGEFIATSDCESCRTHPPCLTIRALLTIYKDHPDAPDPHTQR